MIKVDLITGFLGAGKTTFLKHYVDFLCRRGEKIGIIENDYGAVNVDVMLISELSKLGCQIETIAGGCDYDCHRRRFKTKLIALLMNGVTRIIIEPSGVFNLEEFYDIIQEEPLYSRCEIGSVIALYDSRSDEILSAESELMLATQIVQAGSVVLSRANSVDKKRLEEQISYLCGLCERFGGFKGSFYYSDVDSLSDSELNKISLSGYNPTDIPVNVFSESLYSSLYFMNLNYEESKLRTVIDELFTNIDYGKVIRVKGFFKENGLWYELNATEKSLDIRPVELGQHIIIVIGEKLSKEKIEKVFAE
jgi:G3E family GTPase